MNGTAKVLVAAGAFSAMLAVMLGAFGAHALQGKLSEYQLSVYHTAAQYQMYHSLGLIAIGVLAARPEPLPGLKWAGLLMAAGIIVFSGSLYALSLTGIRVLGAITPIGGVAFIVSWAILAIAALRS